MIVYLDQCAISKLALDHEKDPSTAKLRELLIKGKDQGRILCPLPHETIVESLSLPETERRMVYDLQTHLAAFDENKQVLCAFKTIWKMINEETLAIARDLQPPRPFEFVRWRLPASEDQARKSVEGIENAKSIMTARFDSLAMGGIQQLSDYNEALDLVVHEHASHLLRQIERLSQGEAPSPADHCAYDLASYLVEAQITSDELNRLKHAVIHGRWDAIPVLMYRNMIAAKHELDFQRKGSQKRFDPNDELDLPRMGVALFASSVVITDNKMVAAIEQANVLKFCEAKVFRLREMTQAAEFLKLNEPI